MQVMEIPRTKTMTFLDTAVAKESRYCITTVTLADHVFISWQKSERNITEGARIDGIIKGQMYFKYTTSFLKNPAQN